MGIIAYTMQYTGGEMPSPSMELRYYRDTDYPAYSEVYNDSFADMRRALGLHPVYCCDTREALLNKSEDIFILEIDGRLAGSVAIYGSEIDDLIVARQYRRKGYGKGPLRFAVARMQRMGVSPILLHVADWNRGAVELYLKNGFSIIKTETV